MQPRDIIVIAHDIRSTHNVGSLLRTCEGLGVQHVYFSGYTPSPGQANDQRLPHIAAKLTKQINKTALGAESSLLWSHAESITDLLQDLKAASFTIVGLEQTAHSTPLPQYQPPAKVALLLGREVEGIDAALLTYCDQMLEIPMFGQKESFNVVQAAAMAMYQLRFAPFR